MKTENLEEYIGALLQQPKVDSSIMGETNNIQLLLHVYALGLQHKELSVDVFFCQFDLEKDTPAPYHTLVAQLAILKSKVFLPPQVAGYLSKNAQKLLTGFFHFKFID